jgi:Flp pilus assembly protein TadD
LKPKDTQVMMALGVLLFMLNRFRDAAELFSLAIREDPTNHSLWNKLGAA